MNDAKQAELLDLKKATPYVRTALAFLLKMRYSMNTVENCYATADKFLQILENDVKFQ